MKVQNIRNNNNFCLNKGNYSPNFKGTVSPEFVQYVNEIRKDCLNTESGKKCTTLINNVCDGILEWARNVMGKCFQPKSFLSVVSLNEEPYDTCDNLLVQNETMNKHLSPAYDQGFVARKGHDKPMRRLKELQFWIKGKDGWSLFSEAYGKNFVLIANRMGWDDISDAEYEYSANAVREIVDFLKLERKYVVFLMSESPNDKYAMGVKDYNKLIKSLNKRVKSLEKAGK